MKIRLYLHVEDNGEKTTWATETETRSDKESASELWSRTFQHLYLANADTIIARPVAMLADMVVRAAEKDEGVSCPLGDATTAFFEAAKALLRAYWEFDRGGQKQA